MSLTRSAVVALVLVSGLVSSVASAQTVQGQIIIQEVQPTTTSAPPPQAQVYASPPTDSVYVTPAAPQQMTCPADAQLRVDEYGRQVCMQEVPRHHISGGLLGGGIGLLAGGWLISWISGTVVVVGGAVGCGIGGGCAWTAGGASSAFFNWSWVPIIGPFVQMGYTWENADAGIYAWLAFEGLLQAGGLVMLIFGALGEETIEYQPVPGYALRVMPMVSASTQGISAELRF